MDLNRVFDGPTLEQSFVVTGIPIGGGGGFFDFNGGVFVVGNFGPVVYAVKGELVRGRFSKMERHEHGSLRGAAGDEQTQGDGSAPGTHIDPIAGL